VCAFIQLAPTISESDDVATDLQTLVRGRLESYKCPRRIWFRDRLPRTETGKLLKRQLRTEVAPSVSDPAPNQA
jgi:acyl-coenzyme A synthetase/AMP-(fatty) acid ligase